MDYQSLLIGFRTLENGLCVLSRDPVNDTKPEAWEVIHFEEGKESVEAVQKKILGALGDA
jgi:hypothetical protein